MTAPPPDEQWTVLGLAAARAPWFGRMGAWTTDGRLDAAFVKCLSDADLVNQLGSGRPWSLVILDGSIADTDRDLLAVATDAGVPTAVVSAPGVPTRWDHLGADAELEPDFTVSDVVQILTSVGRRVRRADRFPTALNPSPADLAASDVERRGRLVAVIGPGGTGTSTVAIGVAQALGSNHDVLLADFALRADHAMLHDTREVVPGVQELVEAHRAADLAPTAVRTMTFEIPERGYRLLLGLRRVRDWPVLRPRSVTAGVASLRRAFDVVIADCSPDLDGEADTGSTDVEDRHLLTRRAVSDAEVVVVVGRPSMKGVHSLVRQVHDLLDHGVTPQRILPLVNGAPRRRSARAEITSAIGQLLKADPVAATVANPLHLPVAAIDDAVRDAVELPKAFVEPLTQPVLALLDHSTAPLERNPHPVAIEPGSLGLAGTADELGGEAVA